MYWLHKEIHESMSIQREDLTKINLLFNVMWPFDSNALMSLGKKKHSMSTCDDWKVMIWNGKYEKVSQCEIVK